MESWLWSPRPRRAVVSAPLMWTLRLVEHRQYGHTGRCPGQALWMQVQRLIHPDKPNRESKAPARTLQRTETSAWNRALRCTLLTTFRVTLFWNPYRSPYRNPIYREPGTGLQLHQDRDGVLDAGEAADSTGMGGFTYGALCNNTTPSSSQKL